MRPCAAHEEEVVNVRIDIKGAHGVMLIATSHLISNQVLNLHIEDTRRRKSRAFITKELENETLGLHLHGAVSATISCLRVSADQ
jgi:hypothetical protein